MHTGTYPTALTLSAPDDEPRPSAPDAPDDERPTIPTPPPRPSGPGFLEPTRTPFHRATSVVGPQPQPPPGWDTFERPRVQLFVTLA